MLRIVLPKGSLERATLELFAAADLAVSRSSDVDYRASIADPRVDDVRILRPQEIPRYVADGLFDLGITGRDWVVETGVDVIELAGLDYARSGTGGRVRIVLAVAVDHPAGSAAELPVGSRISTEYPALTRRYFERLGRPMRVFPSYGATEAKVPGIVDAIVDVTETGSTLRTHGLKVIETLLESEVLLIAGPRAAADPGRRAAMDDLATILTGALRAQGRVLLKLNVGAAELDGVLGTLPSMKAPTVAPLAGSGGYAVESVVEKRLVNTLISRLRAQGASDLLELPIRKIIP